jgi:hypothetical protein
MATQITRAALVSILEIKASHATFVALRTRTDARLRKTGNPYPNVRKLSRTQVVIGHKYENSVNNQRKREGSEPTFEAMPRKWGERKAGTPFVEHNGKLYLECGMLRVLDEPQYIAESGDELPREAIEPFLPTKGSNAEHQGVEKEVILRDYAIESITEITIDGERYEIVD